ncbi:MAG TPA: hypothetical protein VN368_03135 [Candidatus Methylomirabilis sp.]|nr:hypothetical protein [Candidatus Methylomirabilis sp.]
MWFFKKKKDQEKKASSETNFFAALTSPAMKDCKDKNIEARTITVNQPGDAQLIITTNTGSYEASFDRVLNFLGSRFDPIAVGKEMLALDTLIERIFIRENLPEPIEYPIFDEQGRPGITASLKMPVIAVVRKGLRTLSLSEHKNNRGNGTADRLYIPVRIPEILVNKLSENLYQHPAVRVLMEAEAFECIGVNPDIWLERAVVSNLVPGYPRPLPSLFVDGVNPITVYIWMEITDRKYYNKILTQIYGIISDFAIKTHPNAQIAAHPAVFMTRTGIGGEICSQILLPGSRHSFGANSSSSPTHESNEINSMGIITKPNPDL